MKKTPSLQIFLGLAVGLLLACFSLYFFPQNGEAPSSEWKTYRNSEGGLLSIPYPADWTAEEVLSYNVDGTEVVYRSVVLIPPPGKVTGERNRIAIGGHRISTCSDVPDATRCAGGAKQGEFPATFTYSKDPYVLEKFDQVLARMLAE